MRQIKFRVWSESRKKWLNECMFDMEIKGAYDFSSDASMRYNYKTDVIVEQFTGFQDSKGSDIYEGDVVYVAGFGIAKAIITHAHGSEFEDFDGCHRSIINAGAENDIGEIIGNIHQNPELLEQNDE